MTRAQSASDLEISAQILLAKIIRHGVSMKHSNYNITGNWVLLLLLLVWVWVGVGVGVCVCVCIKDT